MRGGPSLYLSLARAETILVIDVRLHWCGPDSVGSLVAWPGLWVVLWLFFPVPGMWACLLVFVSLSRVVGFCLIVCVGCSRLWAFGFVYQVFLCSG